MRDITVTDTVGRKTIFSIPDDAPDWHGPMGLRKGPPDISKLDLPIGVSVRINNQLYSRGIITEADAKRNPNEITLAVQAAFRVDAMSILELYG
jgi:hypothetical protein